MVKKKCKECSEPFFVYPYRSEKASFCSYSCKGKFFGEEFGKRLIHTKGAASPSWIGDKISYTGLHNWIRLNFKKSGRCEKCGESKRTTWANKDTQYLRDRSNWLELCYKCHKEHDKNNPEVHKYSSHTRRATRYDKSKREDIPLV